MDGVAFSTSERRLPVRAGGWLPPEQGIPIKDAEIWGRLELGSREVEHPRAAGR